MKVSWDFVIFATIALILAGVLAGYGGAFDSVRPPPGMTAIEGDYRMRESQRSAYHYATQAEVCNSLRYMNVILMDEEARLACRLASDGRPGFRIAEFWEKMREAGR